MGKNEEVERIVFERISLLYEMAEKTEDDKLSRRYIRILREIAKHHRRRVPNGIKRKFCGFCGTLFLRSSSTVRLSRKGYISIRCGSCGRETHLFYRQP